VAQLLTASFFMEDYLLHDKNAQVVKPTEKKKVIAFTIADKKNMPYALMMQNSLRKFHTEEEVPLIIYDEATMDQVVQPEKYYLATPLFAKELLKEYDLVIKIDADTIITHDLNHIINDDSYDVGTVLNWNRTDPQIYGEIGLATILPQEYMNNGFVALRSRAFVEHWWKLCNSVHFPRMPYREQGFLNILYHYGEYKVTCFDFTDKWHGLISKGEWNKMILKDGKLILPQNEDGYPTEDITIIAIHWAGGGNEKKMNYRIHFNDEVVEWFDKLTSQQK
jgi:hypothetical protein